MAEGTGKIHNIAAEIFLIFFVRIRFVVVASSAINTFISQMLSKASPESQEVYFQIMSPFPSIETQHHSAFSLCKLTHDLMPCFACANVCRILQTLPLPAQWDRVITSDSAVGRSQETASLRRRE